MADTELQQLAKTDRNPAQESRYRELLAQAGQPYFQGGNGVQTSQMPFGSGGGGATGGLDYNALLEQQRAAQQQAIAPIISSLQASIPETQQRFAAQSGQLQAEVEPLKQRYDNIIAQIQGAKTEEVGREQTATSREFGRRGISLQSGVFDETLNDRLSPITRYYQGQETGAGLERETGLRQMQNLIANTNIAGTDAERQILSAIAQIQAGGQQDAIQSALSLFQGQQQQQLSREEMALRERIANITQPQQDPGLISVGENTRLFDPTTRQWISQPAAPVSGGGGIPTSSGGGGGVIDLGAVSSTAPITNQFGGGGGGPGINNSYSNYNQLQNLLGWNLMRGQ